MRNREPDYNTPEILKAYSDCASAWRQAHKLNGYVTHNHYVYAVELAKEPVSQDLTPETPASSSQSS